MRLIRSADWIVRGLAAGTAALMLNAVPAAAQSDPNTGALTFTGSFDYASVYFFRGIRQETDPGLTFFPAADLGISLLSGDGRIKSASVNVGIWNSLMTGSSGSDGFSGKSHYELDFYATLNLGFGGGVNLATTFTAYTSPNLTFSAIEELAFKVSKAHRLAPYGLIATELGDGQADGGDNKGTYVELGVGPIWALGGGRATFTLPVKVGLSVKDYYELGTTDKKFGFVDIGGLLTLPISDATGRFGAWNVHGGVDYLFFGDESFTGSVNIDADGDQHSGQVIGIVGIGVSY
jgi:hypothetical protein